MPYVEEELLQIRIVRSLIFLCFVDSCLSANHRLEIVAHNPWFDIGVLSACNLCIEDMNYNQYVIDICINFCGSPFSIIQKTYNTSNILISNDKPPIFISMKSLLRESLKWYIQQNDVNVYI